MRLIGVLDCNNFFVSCERLFRPDLWHKPVAVLSSNDGCVVARSQEVKDLGIPMGVPYFKVKDLCHEAGVALFSSNFTLYRDLSERVMGVLEREVGPIEAYSIDESFFTAPASVTTAELRELRERIIMETGIPVSIGVASSKTIAKQAVEKEKRGSGVCILTGSEWESETKDLAVGEIWGIGGRLSLRYRSAGMVSVADLLAAPVALIEKEFGVVGVRTVRELSGESIYPVTPSGTDVRQSLTSSRSFAKTTSTLADLESAVSYHVAECAQKMRREDLVASKLLVSIRPSRFGDFAYRKHTIEVPLCYPSSSTATLTKAALEAVRQLFDPHVPYKKAGVEMAGLLPTRYVPQTLFEEDSRPPDETELDVVTDRLNARFGHGSVRLASVRADGARASALLRSPSYTTVWKDIPTIRA